MSKRLSFGLAVAAAFALAIPFASPARAAASTFAGGTAGGIDTSALRELAGEDGVKVEVNLSGALLKMLSGAMGDEEPEASKMISDLESINVLILDIDESKSERASATIAKMGDGLAKKGWSAIAKIQEEGETVQVLAHMDGEEAIDGLVVMVNGHDGELVFVNIVGRIDLENLKHLAGNFEIEGLEEALSAHTKGGHGGDTKAKAKSKSKKKATDGEDDEDDDAPRRTRKSVY